MQVTLLVVGLIVGLAAGLGAGWYLWRGQDHAETPESRSWSNRELSARERSSAERRAGASHRSRSHEPSTPPQHRPTPRPRPVTALRYTAPPSPNPDLPDRADAPEEASPAGRVAAPVMEAPAPAPFTSTPGEPEPFEKYEYRPTPRRERPVSIEEPAAATDRQVLQDLLEANRRLTADAELRLRRDGAAASEQLRLDDRQSAPPKSPAPAPDDLLARHRKLDEDSRRMGRRAG